MKKAQRLYSKEEIEEAAKLVATMQKDFHTLMVLLSPNLGKHKKTWRKFAKIGNTLNTLSFELEEFFYADMRIPYFDHTPVYVIMQNAARKISDTHTVYE